jgi:hypothetical protein
MVDPDIIAYLQDNIKKYPVDALREQLRAEGISEPDIEEALKVALRSNKPAPLPAAPLKGLPDPKKRRNSFIFACAAAGGLIGLAIFMMNAPEQPGPGKDKPGEVQVDNPESAYIGRLGFVVHLPQGYMAVPSAQSATDSREIVHFCKTGTDPTQFTDEGLFGPLGIVRLEVSPDPNAGQRFAMENLQGKLEAAAATRKEKYSAGRIDVGSLKGFTLTYEAPFPRLETYIMGNKVRYSFLAGQDDATFRDIVMSLRETQGVH